MNITEADFQSWKHHPVTKVYLRFVLDYADRAKRELADGLCAAEASIDQLAVGKVSGRIVAWQEMAMLDFDHIAAFYAYPEDDKQEQEDLNAA
jgi:hypothetical protein